MGKVINRDRRAYVLDECGGGHAGHLVRMLSHRDDMPEELVDLLAELVGRLQEAEVENGRLEGELQEANSRVDDLAGLLSIMVEHASIQDELQDRAEAALRGVRARLEARRG